MLGSIIATSVGEIGVSDEAKLASMYVMVYLDENWRLVEHLPFCWYCLELSCGHLDRAQHPLQLFEHVTDV